MQKKILVPLFLISVGASAATERQITVSGTCNRRVTPDRGSIIVTADIREKELQPAIRKATESYGRVRDEVKRLGLEALELKTAEYSVGEVREWEKNSQVMKGYRARMGMEVSTADISRLGEVIAIAAREGLRDVGQLRTFLSDEKQMKEHFECLTTAGENARKKAEKLATSLGVKVGEAMSVNEAVTEAPRPGPFMMAAANMRGHGGAMAAPDVEAGQQNLSLNVTVSFSLK